jgi:hypothetical protein
VQFLRLTRAKDPCGESDDYEGEPLILNADTLEQVCPDSTTGGSLVYFRAEYETHLARGKDRPADAGRPHLHVKETVDDVWSMIDARFLAALGTIR